MGKVVFLTEHVNDVVQITMNDRNNKNMFSKEFIDDFTECFRIIKNSDSYKVVVLTGYDKYFASGGTKQELEDVYHGVIDFNAMSFFKAAMDCSIPVISAMQGHAIGGGFVLGLYADIIYLAKESFYTCNFMKFGFTPGIGATYIVPYKIGQSLGSEMLYSARNYQGIDLEKRGIPFKVIFRNEVLNKSLELAAELAEQPKISLELLKRQLTREPKSIINSVIQDELMMHEISFKQPIVLERIIEHFSQDSK